MMEMSTLNGYEIVDERARHEITNLRGEINTNKPDTSHLDLIDIGVDDHTIVQASIGVTKLSESIASLVINYKILTNDLSTNIHNFIDLDKVREALGFTYLEFSWNNTVVILHPAISYSDGEMTEDTSYATTNQRGYTGLMFDAFGGLGRVYSADQNFGCWSLDNSVYRPGTFGTIIINGATVE